MSWLNALLPIVTEVGRKALCNYLDQAGAQAAERQGKIASYSQYPPKILDNYYLTSRIENILAEAGVYAEEDSQSTRQYFRDSYYFAGTNWNQMFVFSPSGNLVEIVLMREWDANLYSQVCQLLTSTCTLMYVTDGEYGAYMMEAPDSEEWNKAITDLEQKGLQKQDLTASFVDNWILEYMDAKDAIPDDYNSLLYTLPKNGRIILFDINSDGMFLYFDTADAVQNSQF